LPCHANAVAVFGRYEVLVAVRTQVNPYQTIIIRYNISGDVRFDFDSDGIELTPQQ